MTEFASRTEVVIPGRPEGSGPEPMNKDISRIRKGRCSWVPGSRHAAPRNDIIVASLLADAEIAEDHGEQILDIDRTGDAAEATQGEPEIRVRVENGLTRSPGRQGLDR